MPAAVQRNAIAAFRHRFTLRQTRRTVPIMFSIELVQASERLSFIGKPRRLTVLGQALGFAGQTGNNNTSGADGVLTVTSGGVTTLYAGDGNSTLGPLSRIAA